MTHPIIKAGSSRIYHLQAGDPGAVNGVIQSKFKGLRTRGAYGVNPSPRVGKDETRGPAQAQRQGKKGAFLLPLLFVLFRPSKDGMMPPTLASLMF